jgi:hypothetical protein
MAKYRKKPIVIEARQFSGFDAGPNLCPTYLSGWMAGALISNQKGKLIIHTLEGDMVAEIGDWIIQGVKGEFYPCKPDIFTQTYESAECPADESYFVDEDLPPDED